MTLLERKVLPTTSKTISAPALGCSCLKVAIPAGSPQAAGSPSTALAADDTTEVLQDAPGSFHIAAEHMHSHVPLPFNSNTATDTDAPQLLGLDSLAGLDLGGLLQRLASRPRESGSQASLRSYCKVMPACSVHLDCLLTAGLHLDSRDPIFGPKMLCLCPARSLCSAM